MPKHLAPGGQVWIYELPAHLDEHATTNPQAAIQAQLVKSLRASPYVATDPKSASFYLIPLPFDGNPGFQGREDSGTVLSFVRHTWPWFNESLRHAEPNHLLTFVGDHGIDLVVRDGVTALREPKPRRFGRPARWVMLSGGQLPESKPQGGGDAAQPVH